jgi:protein-S-isoprenylcysteine O-methyltransferase Ste14
VLKNIALRANAFAVTEVRLQPERAQTVADAGPYRFVRHPFYAADPLILIGSALWLGSYVAAASAALPLTLMVIRLQREEHVLRQELAGYGAYATRVRYGSSLRSLLISSLPAEARVMHIEPAPATAAEGLATRI